jgi:hypothetical protein
MVLKSDEILNRLNELDEDTERVESLLYDIKMENNTSTYKIEDHLNKQDNLMNVRFNEILLSNKIIAGILTLFIVTLFLISIKYVDITQRYIDLSNQYIELNEIYTETLISDDIIIDE